jgi:hypothetical protein
MSSELLCPGCGSGHDRNERFCLTCGLPLVHAPGIADEPKADGLAQQARKVKPGYAEGPLVRVAAARHQAEAELVQGMLLEEGIPSLARRSGGFDVPDFLASGPRDILVPSSGVDAAHDLLGLDRRPPGWSAAMPPTRAPGWVRALAFTLALVLIVSAIVGALAGLLL